MAPRVKQLASLPIGEFFERHAKALSMSLLSDAHGFDRTINEPAPNRPGLALSGFFSYFAKKRIQVLGNSEMSYLKKLNPEMRGERFGRMCERDIPAIVVSRGATLSDDLLSIAANHRIPVFNTKLVTMKFLNAATLKLEQEFAPTTTLHGCMLDVRGIGVLIMGKSGSGKSETAIGLLERGSALVADDMVRITWVGDELRASAPELSRGYIEIRGIGIVNVANLYGLTSIRPEKRLDLVVTLTPHANLNDVDRVGIKPKTHQVLGQKVPMVEIPVAAGRDTARMVTIAALDQQLRRLGYNMADEFNDRLLQHMAENSRDRGTPINPKGL
ncbi:HPr(Ser) kinase/phosphatase [Haloferula rosea]|uniref:HPr kinase/phosphorylase n=1 Tax=Haloferula rosea TaxID=490093 RepID=A0A934RFZ6_9BACT|nr:HPr(Ser) kinase/phosphatase [Haloferula rosea]MBK1828883.1 HPr(Ser) kinase/phosphatase [Haloferula rosea]